MDGAGAQAATPACFGVETEYGITVVGRPEVNPVLASSLVVTAYGEEGGGPARWDYDDESPLCDARGFTADLPDAPQEEDPGLANAILTNGARLYVDHAHPEYSTPEVTDPRDLVVWDRAGERIMERAATKAGERLPDRPGRIVITKNNTDGKGASYGCHENYLVGRHVPFGRIARQITPFLVSRQVLLGAGRIGNELRRDDVPYQISQRADFVETEIGLETTLKRPIVNTRDEPHADPERYRRLHVIVGDANMSETATYLKVGSTALVLSMLDRGVAPEPPELDDPVRAMRTTSHDLSCRPLLRTADGRRMTPIEIQWHYLEHARKHHEQGGAPEWAGGVLDTWERLLGMVEDDPARLDGVADWVTKLNLLERYRERDGLQWWSDKLRLVDLQYHDVSAARGLHRRLETAGRVDRLTDEREVLEAMRRPPEDTRAWFRGRCVERYGAQVVAAGWDSLVLDVGDDALRRVPMMEPTRGGRDQVERLLEASPDAAALVRGLDR